MRILVTGVAGRVGSSLAQRLVLAGHDVRGTVRPEGRRPHRWVDDHVDVRPAELTDTGALESAVRGVDVVVHAAAQMGIAGTPPDRFLDVNVGGTVRLLEAAVQAPGVQRFVFVSTDNTYGPARPRTRPIDEEHPQLPGDYYGTAKVLAEQVVRNYHELYGIDYSIMRLGSVRAPDEASGMFRLSWVRRFLTAHAAAGRRSNLWPLFAGLDDLTPLVDAAAGDRTGDPAVVLTDPAGRSWSIHLTDVRDAVSGLVLGITHSAAANDTFNITGPGTTTFTDGAATLARHCGADVVEVALPVRLDFELSNAKAARRLGYQPEWDFDAMVRTSTAPMGEPLPDYVPVGA